MAVITQDLGIAFYGRITHKLHHNLAKVAILPKFCRTARLGIYKRLVDLVRKIFLLCLCLVYRRQSILHAFFMIFTVGLLHLIAMSEMVGLMMK